MTARKVVRWFALALGVISVLAGLYLSIFFLPYPLFRHHMTAAGFSVYSDREIPEDFRLVLADARRRVDAMPLDRGGSPPRIFICRSRRLFELLVTLAGKRHAGQGLLISAARNVFLSADGIRSVAGRSGARPAHSRLEGSWSGAIAHEVAHQLIADELGLSRTRKIPAWKSEGYADHVANLASVAADPDADLASRFAILLDDDTWRGPSARIDRRHFRWQLEVEYLCTVQKLDLSGLLDPDVTEAWAWDQLLEWCRSQERCQALEP